METRHSYQVDTYKQVRPKSQWMKLDINDSEKHQVRHATEQESVNHSDTRGENFHVRFNMWHLQQVRQNIHGRTEDETRHQTGELRRYFLFFLSVGNSDPLLQVHWERDVRLHFYQYSLPTLFHHVSCLGLYKLPWTWLDQTEVMLVCTQSLVHRTCGHHNYYLIVVVWCFELQIHRYHRLRCVFSTRQLMVRTCGKTGDGDWTQNSRIGVSGCSVSQSWQVRRDTHNRSD